jgi:hypothetical protein
MRTPVWSHYIDCGHATDLQPARDTAAQGLPALRADTPSPSAASMLLAGAGRRADCCSGGLRIVQESHSCRADGLPRKPSQFQWSARISPALYLAVHDYTLKCLSGSQLRTRAPDTSRVPTAAERLQRSCTRAARRLTEVWRSVCRGTAGSRCEGGKALGDRGGFSTALVRTRRRGIRRRSPLTRRTRSRLPQQLSGRAVVRTRVARRKPSPVPAVRE